MDTTTENQTSEDSVSSPVQDTEQDLPGYTQNKNFSIDELDRNTESKLRGDAIGETMYSESFVVKTLLKLSDVQWNTELEDDLCFLWDMTLEKEVCDYLFNLKYPAIACGVIIKYDENRLIEIVIGILANIFSVECTKAIMDEEILTVLEILNSDDPLILIQVVRFVKAVSYFDRDLKFLTSTTLDKLYFILANSLNVDLLKTGLDALSSLVMNSNFDGKFFKLDMINSCLNAYQTIRKESSDEDDYIPSHVQITFTHVLNIVTSFSTYLDSHDNKNVNKISPTREIILNELNILLNCYKNEDYLLPVNEHFTFYIETISYICPILNIGYNKDMFRNLLTIIDLLIKNNSLDVSLFSDAICYFISIAEIEQVKKDVQDFTEKTICDIVDKFKSELEQSNNEQCKQILSFYSNEHKT